MRTLMRTLNWPEPYEACREGAVNRRLAPAFTGRIAKSPADWALRTQKTTLPATISMKRRCRGHRATVTRERPSSGSGSSVMCVLGSPLWNVKLLPQRSSSSGTLSTCSNARTSYIGYLSVRVRIPSLTRRGRTNHKLDAMRVRRNPSDQSRLSRRHRLVARTADRPRKDPASTRQRLAPSRGTRQPSTRSNSAAAQPVSLARRPHQ